MGVPITDVASMRAARINSLTVQNYLCDIWYQTHRWEVKANSVSQGLPAGLAAKFWARFPGDVEYMEINRGSIPAS